MATGTLYGLGLGPGDPELVTLKALRLLCAAPVVAYPAPEEGGGASFARQIAAEWLDPPHPTLSPSGGEGRVRGTRQREIAIRFPMRPGPPPIEIYRSAAARLAAVLDGGEDVAYLCQGDPLFYGSFVGIMDCLAGRYPVAIVPGVSSLGACAAAAALPLVRRDEALSVLPATLPEDELARRLAASEAAAIIKLGRHFAKLRRVLGRLGLLEGAVYVERATMPNQRILPLAAADPASVPYFATALVPARPGRNAGILPAPPHPTLSPSGGEGRVRGTAGGRPFDKSSGARAPEEDQ